MSFLEEFHRAVADEKERARDAVRRIHRFNDELCGVLEACSVDDLLGPGITATTVEEGADGCVAELRSPSHLIRVTCQTRCSRLAAGQRSLALDLSITPNGKNPVDGPGHVLSFDEDEDIQSAHVEVMRLLGFGLARAEMLK